MPGSISSKIFPNVFVSVSGYDCQTISGPDAEGRTESTIRKSGVATQVLSLLSETVKTATKLDIDLLASCLLKLAQFAGSSSTDPYAKGLAGLSLDNARDFVDATLSKDDGFAVIDKSGDTVTGCLIGSVDLTSFLPSGIGYVGRIEAVWVDDGFRGNGIGRQLVAEAERRFRASKKDVNYVELSYLAGNQLASHVWDRLGYEPFRVFSFKQL